MEMHQIRYFLAAARTLNFTRAAKECNVAQPSLTRAIKLLEGELGGDLFRRERNLSHLTELGERMLPLMQQCYDSAQSAKALADNIKSGATVKLRLGLSRTINIELIVPHLTELMGNLQGLELKFVRGDAQQLLESLKKGEVEIVVACLGAARWERLDAWPLFSEGFSLATNEHHRLASCDSIDLIELKTERLLVRPYCESYQDFMSFLRDAGVFDVATHEVDSDNDAVDLLEAGAGIAILPQSAHMPPQLRRIRIDRFRLTRTVAAYAVAGRQRSIAAMTLLKLLRSADWQSSPAFGSAG